MPQTATYRPSDYFLDSCYSNEHYFGYRDDMGNKRCGGCGGRIWKCSFCNEQLDSKKDNLQEHEEKCYFLWLLNE